MQYSVYNRISKREKVWQLIWFFDCTFSLITILTTIQGNKISSDFETLPPMGLQKCCSWILHLPNWYAMAHRTWIPGNSSFRYILFHVKKDSKQCCDTSMPESIHTKDESKHGSSFACIFGVNWPVQSMWRNDKFRGIHDLLQQLILPIAI